jgi:hypothetical protein
MNFNTTPFRDAIFSVIKRKEKELKILEEKQNLLKFEIKVLIIAFQQKLLEMDKEELKEMRGVIKDIIDKDEE